MKKVWRKIRNAIYDSCDLMELVMALVMVIAIVVAVVSLWGPFVEFIDGRFEHDAFLTFVGYIFNILIGIEFLKMLSHPSADTVLEVLIFLVARHMVIEDTTVIENLLSIVSIGTLFAIKKYLNLPTSKDSTDIFVTEYDWDKLQEKRKKRAERTEQMVKEKTEKLQWKMDLFKEDSNGESGKESAGE